MGSLFAALGLVFIAELGDKTQLVAMGFGARHRLAPVLLGITLAYAACNLLAVVVGGVLGAALPTRAIGIVGGVLFLGFAAWTLRGMAWGESAADEEADADAEAEEIVESAERGAANRGVVISVALAMFVAELGDKTQIATATLAAQGNPVLVWIGATLGIILSGALGVLVGRFFGARLPERVTQIGSAVLFALFGLVLIGTNL
jgi:putative Ca2+/H+ antiporter (TMEM165/GDT1 family)